jgi:hypothetical protein
MGRSKVLCAALFLFLTVTVANAYTVVMRDGRRVEIPNQFTVTDSTLTYDVGSGMQITIQLNTVDIAATERANGEVQGAFLKKANASVESAPQTRRTTAERSITNADLEKFRRARLESEKQYETERQELGMPSLEERRREVTEIEDRTLEQVRSMRAQEEAYWRSRAEAMRAENEAQFGSLRQTPEPVPFGYSVGGFGAFDGVGFGVNGGSFGRFRRVPSSPFDGFLATPITPFPRFPFDGRRRIFTAPGIRTVPRIVNTRRGSHR